MEADERELIFDPAELFAQLSELLKLYLARAAQPAALEAVSPKDAVGCSKTIVELMATVQGGKLSRVDTATEWPRLEFAPVAQTQRRAGRAHPPGSTPAGQAAPCARQPAGGLEPAAPPILSLEDAVSAVCQADPETAELEPWALLLTRINRLTQRLAADLEEWKAACAAGSDAADGVPLGAGSGHT